MTIPIAQQYFKDPISGKLLEDPVMNSCGHSYSRRSLTEWNKVQKTDCCPLCQKSLAGIIQDAVLSLAVNLVSRGTNREYTELQQFTDEDQEIIQAAISRVVIGIENDNAKNIPSRLTPYFANGILNRAADCMAQACQ